MCYTCTFFKKTHRKLLTESVMVYEFRFFAGMVSPGLLVEMDTFQLTPSAPAINRMVSHCILPAPITTEVYWLAKFIHRTAAFMCHLTAKSIVISNMKCWWHNLVVCTQFIIHVDISIAVAGNRFPRM